LQDQGDPYGKGDCVLRTEELPETVEAGPSATVRKGYRVLLADKEISLAGTGFQTDSGAGRWSGLDLAHEGWSDSGASPSQHNSPFAGFDSVYNFARWPVDTSNDAEDLVQKIYLNALRNGIFSV
jgi:hypothetical protein